MPEYFLPSLTRINSGGKRGAFCDAEYLMCKTVAAKGIHPWMKFVQKMSRWLLCWKRACYLTFEEYRLQRAKIEFGNKWVELWNALVCLIWSSILYNFSFEVWKWQQQCLQFSSMHCRTHSIKRLLLIFNSNFIFYRRAHQNAANQFWFEMRFK